MEVGYERFAREKAAVLMIRDQYVWFVWASTSLLAWLIGFRTFPRYRKVMLRASVLTAIFGLMEPLFVPEYWDPPSLFDRAQRTGFDIESLIFTFALGGVAAVLFALTLGMYWTGVYEHVTWTATIRSASGGARTHDDSRHAVANRADERTGTSGTS